MERIIAITPTHLCDPQIAVAACRAGEMGILDLGLQNTPDAMASALDKLASLVGKNGRWGIRWDTIGAASRAPARLAQYVQYRVEVLVLGGVPAIELGQTREEAKRVANQVFLEVYDLESARAAQTAGYDGVIVKGHEAGGRVARLTSFMLLQELREKLDIPYWIQGGISPHTAAARRCWWDKTIRCSGCTAVPDAASCMKWKCWRLQAMIGTPCWSVC